MSTASNKYYSNYASLDLDYYRSKSPAGTQQLLFYKGFIHLLLTVGYSKKLLIPWIQVKSRINLRENSNNVLFRIILLRKVIPPWLYLSRQFKNYSLPQPKRQTIHKSYSHDEFHETELPWDRVNLLPAGAPALLLFWKLCHADDLPHEENLLNE